MLLHKEMEFIRILLISLINSGETNHLYWYTILISNASQVFMVKLLSKTFFPAVCLIELNSNPKRTWKFLLRSIFLSDSICRNFDRSPLIWLSILMMYWKSLCVRRFSTSIDCDMFCTFWKEWNSTALIFPSTTGLKCPPCSAACRVPTSQGMNQHFDLQSDCL